MTARPPRALRPSKGTDAPRGRRTAGALCLALTLTACTQASQDELARSAARASTASVLAERLPGVPVQPAVNCVIDNASAQQIYALAADSVTGPTESTTEIVTGILRQPQTLTCLAAEGLPALMR